MATLLKNVTNSICHAFNALQQNRDGFVSKSKLKVSVVFELLELKGPPFDY